MHLQLATVWLGQLAERVAVPGPRSRDQVACHHLHYRVTFSPLVAVPSCIDTGRGANWAVGRTVVSRRRGGTSSTALSVPAPTDGEAATRRRISALGPGLHPGPLSPSHVRGSARRSGRRHSGTANAVAGPPGNRSTTSNATMDGKLPPDCSATGRTARRSWSAPPVRHPRPGWRDNQPGQPSAEAKAASGDLEADGAPTRRHAATSHGGPTSTAERRQANWAVGERPVSGCRGVYLIDGYGHRTSTDYPSTERNQR